MNALGEYDNEMKGHVLGTVGNDEIHGPYDSDLVPFEDDFILKKAIWLLKNQLFRRIRKFWENETFNGLQYEREMEIKETVRVSAEDVGWVCCAEMPAQLQTLPSIQKKCNFARF